MSLYCAKPCNVSMKLSFKMNTFSRCSCLRKGKQVLTDLYTWTKVSQSNARMLTKDILLEKSYPRCHNVLSRANCVLLLSGDLQTIRHRLYIGFRNTPTEVVFKQICIVRRKEGNWMRAEITELWCSRRSIESVSLPGSISFLLYSAQGNDRCWLSKLSP